MKKGMVDRNPHTGEALRSKHNSDAYRDNFEKIFKKVSICELCGDEDVTTCKIRNCPNREQDAEATT